MLKPGILLQEALFPDLLFKEIRRMKKVHNKIKKNRDDELKALYKKIIRMLKNKMVIDIPIENMTGMLTIKNFLKSDVKQQVDIIKIENDCIIVVKSE